MSLRRTLAFTSIDKYEQKLHLDADTFMYIDIHPPKSEQKQDQLRYVSEGHMFNISDEFMSMVSI